MRPLRTAGTATGLWSLYQVLRKQEDNARRSSVLRSEVTAAIMEGTTLELEVTSSQQRCQKPVLTVWRWDLRKVKV